MTKPITSRAFMMLVEKGKVALDDPVEMYIPEWAGMGVFVSGQLDAFVTRPVARPMQIVDLLRHTSGLIYGYQNRTIVDAAYRKTGVGVVGGRLSLENMIAALPMSAGVLARALPLAMNARSPRAPWRCRTIRLKAAIWPRPSLIPVAAVSSRRPPTI